MDYLFCFIGTGLYVSGADFLGIIYDFHHVYSSFVQPFASSSLDYPLNDRSVVILFSWCEYQALT